MNKSELFTLTAVYNFIGRLQQQKNFKFGLADPKKLFRNLLKPKVIYKY